MKTTAGALFLCYRMKNLRLLDILPILAYTNNNDSNGAVGIYPQCFFTTFQNAFWQKRRSIV